MIYLPLSMIDKEGQNFVELEEMVRYTSPALSFYDGESSTWEVSVSTQVMHFAGTKTWDSSVQSLVQSLFMLGMLCL